MHLQEGLATYQSQNRTYYDWAITLEQRACSVLDLLDAYGNQPTDSALTEAQQFLMEVEKWKAGCLKQRMGNAIRNDPWRIWQAFQYAVAAKKSNDDMGTLESIMELKGFGSSEDDETGLRRAKTATSVLRFLWPDSWGVVDWRVAATLGLLDPNDLLIDITRTRTLRRQEAEFRGDFDIIPAEAACEYNQWYRSISEQYPQVFPRAADVEMAVFGLSLVIWPLK